MKKYYLSPGLDVAIIDAERLSLTLYGKRMTVQDRAGLLRSLIDSAARGLDIHALPEQRFQRYSPDAISATVQFLLNSKILLDVDSRSMADSTRAFLSYVAAMKAHTGADSDHWASAERWRAAVVGTGMLAEQLAATISAHGIELLRRADMSDIPIIDNVPTLVVACADEENHAFFRSLNQQAIEAKLPTLYVALDWHIVRCGPLVIPQANACYECYFHRVSATRLHAEEFSAHGKVDNILYRPVPSKLSIHWAIAVSMSQILSYLSGIAPDLHLSPIREVDALKGEVFSSHLLKLPRCPVCGSGNARRPGNAIAAPKLHEMKA
ncbi:bacteriocin biosynthesis cyclodehydratase domain-containing protein [Oxalobacteraceae bacterium GrIS 1.11]